MCHQPAEERNLQLRLSLGYSCSCFIAWGGCRRCARTLQSEPRCDALNPFLVAWICAVGGRRHAASASPTRQDLVKPPSVLNALQPYVLREVLAAIQAREGTGAIEHACLQQGSRSQSGYIA